MNSVYVLVKDGVVENLIVAAPEFIEQFQLTDEGKQYQYMICIDNLSPAPWAGWSYDGENFSEPTLVIGGSDV